MEDIYLREENKKIYIKSSPEKEEIITYDFNLTVGDTFYLKSYDTLLVKEDKYENGYRELLLECLNNEYLGEKIWDVWTEGIGSDKDFLHPNIFSSLMCFEGDNEHSETCDYIDKILKVSDYKDIQLEELIYPNPTIDKLYFQNGFNNFKEYKIFDFKGELIKFKPIENTFIDVFDIPTGTYLLQLQGEGLTHTNKFEKINGR